MMTLTKIMREKLQNADLERGEINDVAMSTMYGLEERGLVPNDWRMGNSRGVTNIHHGGDFPRYSKVKLTKEGFRTARMIQGLRPDV